MSPIPEIGIASAPFSANRDPGIRPPPHRTGRTDSPHLGSRWLFFGLRQELRHGAWSGNLIRPECTPSCSFLGSGVENLAPSSQSTPRKELTTFGPVTLKVNASSSSNFLRFSSLHCYPSYSHSSARIFFSRSHGEHRGRTAEILSSVSLCLRERISFRSRLLTPSPSKKDFPTVRENLRTEKKDSRQGREGRSNHYSVFFLACLASFARNPIPDLDVP